jgi:organic hydroperoxide reductase OsmC/OhrA
MAHIFLSHLEWPGAAKGPTRDAATFSRDLNVTLGGIALPMSSAPAFRGDPSRINPEELFVASLSACQALTYLYLAAKNQIAVVGYSDDAHGELEMVEARMRMSRVTLRPQIVLDRGADATRARDLVEKAHANCFIANSVAVTVSIEPTVSVSRGSPSRPHGDCTSGGTAHRASRETAASLEPVH